MILKIVVEVLILWAWMAIYMEILVRKCEPVGGLFFYPKVMQDVSNHLVLPRNMDERTASAYH